MAAETFWTAERVAELTALIAERVSYRAIADRLGCTKNAVSGKAKRLGIILPIDGPTPRTLHDRMDAEHARMDAVLAECVAAGAHRRGAR
jgi:hypothetical protein